MERKPAAVQGDGVEDAGWDHLPERLRRVHRFGGAQAAALAEAEALRREIDALAARLARSEAGRVEAGHLEAGLLEAGRNQITTLVRQDDARQSPGTTSATADEFPVTALIPASDSLRAWLALRRAGLAVGDAIQRLSKPRNAAAD